MNPELATKLDHVRQLLGKTRTPAALIGLQSNFSWLSCGGEAHVALNSREAAARLLVTRDDQYVIANTIEMPRLKQEVLKGLPFQAVEFPWHEPEKAAQALGKIVDPKKVLADVGDLGARARPEKFIPLRSSLLPEEAKRYRLLGRDAEAAISASCRGLEPGQSEFEIAGDLATTCSILQLTPVLVLVATDERIRKFRHPQPTAKKLERTAMLVLCARRGGQIVALSRMASFGKPSADLQKRHRAVCAVEVALHQSTLPGKTIGSAFKTGIDEYKKQGFADEWLKHHQGGPCGYEGRDFIANAASKQKIANHQPFAWNPSITGTKSEDTLLTTDKGPEVVTEGKKWPTIKIEWQGKPHRRPDILELE